jgi:hypothetical protein
MSEVEKAREESMRIIEYLADRYDMSHCEPEAIRDLLAVIDDLLAVRADLLAVRAESVGHVANCLCCDTPDPMAGTAHCGHCNRHVTQHPCTDQRCLPGLTREAIIRAEADVSAKELLLIYAKTPVDRGRIRISVDLQDELQCNLDRARAELERLKGTVRE